MKLLDPVLFSGEEEIEPLSVRVPVALKMVGLSRSKFYELVQDGEIEIVKVGRSTLVVVESLRGFLERKRQMRSTR